MDIKAGDGDRTHDVQLGKLTLDWINRGSSVYGVDLQRFETHLFSDICNDALGKCSKVEQKTLVLVGVHDRFGMPFRHNQQTQGCVAGSA